MRRIALFLGTAAGLLSTSATAAAADPIPRSWFGVMADGPFTDDGSTINFQRQADMMADTGVGFARFTIQWSHLQPYRSMDDVPAADRARFRGRLDGHPVDYRVADRVVGGAARAGLDVLPVVLSAPRWAAANPDVEAPRPRSNRQYARFVRGLLRRYGPGGVYWRQHPNTPARPIRRWQIWNEPNIERFWDASATWPRGYTALLRQTAELVRAEDPTAQIVLAGLTNRVGDDLAKLYAAGAGKLFDVAAGHPYRTEVSAIVDAVKGMRMVMDEYGDMRKPLMLTEFSWSSGQGENPTGLGIESDPGGQALLLRDTLLALAKVRVAERLAAVSWYTWMQPLNPGKSSFDFSGLNAYNGRSLEPKPALLAYRGTALALQGKATQARRP